MEFDSGDGCTTFKYIKPPPQILHFKRVRELYLKKKYIHTALRINLTVFLQNLNEKTFKTLLRRQINEDVPNCDVPNIIIMSTLQNTIYRINTSNTNSNNFLVPIDLTH